MKDKNDTQTIDGLKRGPGRPRKYADAAERQKAYRERTTEKTRTVDEISIIAMREIMTLRDEQHGKHVETKQALANKAEGIYQVWKKLAGKPEVLKNGGVIEKIYKSMEV